MRGLREQELARRVVAGAATCQASRQLLVPWSFLKLIVSYRPLDVHAR